MRNGVVCPLRGPGAEPMLRMLSQLRDGVKSPAVIPETGARLYTIGYQGYSQRAYVQALASRSITVLCDLRRTAVSRQAGFERLALADACARTGIRYEHLWQLGVPAERRYGARAVLDRSLLVEDYRQRILPHQRPSLQRIYDWLLGGERVALTTFERSPAEGHRGCVAEELQRTFGNTCTPIHL